jgi:hypothetical protein
MGTQDAGTHRVCKGRGAEFYPHAPRDAMYPSLRRMKVGGQPRIASDDTLAGAFVGL